MTKRVSDERLALDLRDARAALVRLGYAEDASRQLEIARERIAEVERERDQWKRACEDMLPAETQRQLEHERDALKADYAECEKDRTAACQEWHIRVVQLKESAERLEHERDALREALAASVETIESLYDHLKAKAGDVDLRFALRGLIACRKALRSTGVVEDK